MRGLNLGDVVKVSVNNKQRRGWLGAVANFLSIKRKKKYTVQATVTKVNKLTVHVQLPDGNVISRRLGLVAA